MLHPQLKQPSKRKGPQVAPSFTIVDVEELDGAASPRRIVREQAGPWGASAGIHLLFLALLLAWTVPLFPRGDFFLTLSRPGDAAELEELVFVDEEGLETPAEFPAFEDETPGDVTSLVTPELAVVELLLEPASTPHPEPDANRESPVVDPVATPTIGGPNGSLSGAATVEAAVDRVTGRIQSQLEQGDVLVVWLLDASLSLVDDRQRVAERLESFFRQIDSTAGSATAHRLVSAVVAFGAGAVERIAPTEMGQRVVQSIKDVPIDASGKENLMGAVQSCVNRYRRSWKSQLTIIVWTDESGDDTARLEKTIAICNQHDVTVSVVGPSAVLGADTGLHAFLDPKTKVVFQLPVTRGPDTATRERLRLGYWYPSRPPRPTQGQDWRSPFELPSWYGGENLAGMASGFGPHALTRLTLAAGGAYTIFDRPEDRGPFELERMRDYLPDYGSADAYLRKIQSNPLRKAVHDAVQATLAGRELGAPELDFFGQRSEIPPHRIERFYLTPLQFRTKLRSSRRRQLREAQQIAAGVAKALALVSRTGDPAVGFEAEYRLEDSPRWRAWYDLTRGRLLAASVRIEEYRLAWERLFESEFLAETTNYVVMGPTNEMHSDADFIRRGDEAQRLLLRCVRDNPDTPWAYLAQRELDYGLGVMPRQAMLHPVDATPSPRAPKLPKF